MTGWGLALVAMIALAAWAPSHAYLGLYHDAGLYTLQALSHLHVSLQQDVFLKFGSQDRFTVFSPVYAAAIGWFGAEPAAALLTFLSQGAVVAGAYAVGRAVLTSWYAALGVAVLVAIPGDYGADHIFTCIEPFLTPRMLAEGLTLAGMAAALTVRRTWAGLLLLVATLVHPIMAAAGLAALLWWYVGIRRPRLVALLSVAGIGVVALQVGLAADGIGRRFDPSWMRLIQNRSPYLFMAHWHLDDWARAAVTLTTLATAAFVLPGDRARLLARLSLVTVLAGFILTAIAADAMQLVVFTQLQPWRWQWLGTVTAALLLPTTLAVLGARGVAGRTSLLLLVAAWVFGGNVNALIACSGALLALPLIPRLKPTEARWVLAGACALLAMAVTWRLASNLQFTESYYLDQDLPQWLRRTMSFTRDGALVGALLAVVAWQRRRPAVLGLMTLLVSAACLMLLPETVRLWTSGRNPAAQMADFEPLRGKIPAGADVFWPSSPVQTWQLLQRPSYISVLQTSGMVFSRAAAMELDRRARALGASIAPDVFTGWSSSGTGLNLSAEQLRGVCQTGEFRFMIAGLDLGLPASALVATTSAGIPKALYLYECPQTLAAAAST